MDRVVHDIVKNNRQEWAELKENKRMKKIQKKLIEKEDDQEEIQQQPSLSTYQQEV